MIAITTLKRLVDRRQLWKLLLIGYDVKNLAQELIYYGAEKVIVVDNKMLENFVTEPYTKALITVINEEKPEVVLVGATSIGRDLAPRVSARIHTGLTADCTSLDVDEENMASLYELAKELKGEVSGSRAAIDNGWLEFFLFLCLIFHPKTQVDLLQLAICNLNENFFMEICNLYLNLGSGIIKQTELMEH